MAIIKPFMTSRRFNSTISAGTGAGATFNILATACTNDAGGAATAFPSSFAYYNLYLNGQLQAAGDSSVTTAAITIPNADALDPGVPVTIEFVVN
ncbi:MULTISPECIES: DUF4183 domain-containing protein [unclassified Bacillus (in: firmicutes)]|uniref:DUF4183 domain-containing protein n=1 Tax=unclassified Bacillus (in: firmicutes) TaxID=185979 RepID=UPI0008F03B86|nr:MULTISPECIES: DUF4183 domain-containing protein [unclassified Bacillus (in: firmicutes)]SFI71279.1 protein of unknown function [Bacillus sp. 71mf]SFS89157.1 protein of unknown function [Bacillus sp. 103mf]